MKGSASVPSCRTCPSSSRWTGEGCGKAVVQAHSREAMYIDRPVTLLTDVDTPEDFAAVQSGPT